MSFRTLLDISIWNGTSRRSVALSNSNNDDYDALRMFVYIYAFVSSWYEKRLCQYDIKILFQVPWFYKVFEHKTVEKQFSNTHFLCSKTLSRTVFNKYMYFRTKFNCELMLRSYWVQQPRFKSLNIDFSKICL